MSGSTQELINLFVRPPANSVYFIMTMVSCLICLLMVMGHEAHRSRIDHYRRYTLAFGLMTLAWILPLLVAIFSLANNVSITAILPPLERFSIAITLLLTVWIFAPIHTVLNRLTQLSVIICSAGLVVTQTQWSQMVTQMDFNLSAFAIWWTFAHTLLALVGILIVGRYFILIEDSPLKLVYFVILMTGGVFTLIQTAQGYMIGNDAGAMRISVILALLLLLMIMYRDIVRDYRLSLEDLQKQSTPVPQPVLSPVEPAPISPAMRESVQLLRALGVMLDSTVNTLPQAVLRAVIDMVKVDVAALLRLKDANYADVVVAYDRIFEREFSGMAINLNYQPTLVNSVERRSQRPLLVDRNHDELKDLYARLDIPTMGPAYFQPLSKDNQVISVLLVALPYTTRELTKAEESLLQGIAVIAANLLHLAYVAQDAQMMAEENAIQQMVNRALTMQPVNEAERQTKQNLQAELDLARQQIAQLTSEINALKSAIHKEQKRVSDELSETQEGLSVSQKMIALSTSNEKLRQERDELIHKLQQAEIALHAALNTSDDARYQDYIESLKREKASLEAQKMALQVQLDELRANDRVIMPADFKNMLDRMIIERDELIKQRDGLELRLNAINEQLQHIGVEQGVDGLVQLVSKLTDQRSELQSQNTILQTNLAALLAEHERLQHLREHEHERDATIQTLQKELEHLAHDREIAVRQRDELQAELATIKSNLKVFKAKWTQLQAQVDSYAKQLQAFRNHQAANQSVVVDQQVQTIAKYTTENADLLLALIQELRTPMTSIMGYVDLLLSEASGILGEMQRKFLQRVATNVNRLRLMLDELIQIAELDTGHLSLMPAPINIPNLIEDMITNTALNFREKGLTVNLSVQDNIPDVEADRDAIEQVLMQLLNNAFLVSPPSSQISIRASKRQVNLNGDDKIDCVLITVEDKGGGIQEEDIPRVFARKYKAQNPLIAGLGDTGVGLSVAKALVEAQNGRLWVESRPNVGSSFNFLLPIHAIPATKAITDES